MMQVKCEKCGHPATLSGRTASTWQCNCAAGVDTPHDKSGAPKCKCDHANVVEEG